MYALAAEAAFPSPHCPPLPIAPVIVYNMGREWAAVSATPASD